MQYHAIALLMGILLFGCSQRDDFAPISTPVWKTLNAHQNKHVVQPKDTLYAIAFRYDQDYHKLAQLNHLPYPYNLRVGQVVIIRPQPNFKLVPSAATQSPQHPAFNHKPLSNLIARSNLPSDYAQVHKPYKNINTTPSLGAATNRNSPRIPHWIWPASGHIVSNFHPRYGNKGIDIAGKKGGIIRAVASGRVAYAGNGITGYGNLIIIKHDKYLLTAYGNNAHNLVKTGQFVQVGQQIAHMGMLNKQHYGVHFEIRKTGKPVNPLIYLQKS